MDMENNDIPVKAIRGATTVHEDSELEILEATKELMEQMISANQLSEHRIVSVIFSATSDVTKVFPAKAARELGFKDIPLLCCSELDIEGMLPKCIRIMMHAWMPGEKSIPVYLRDAVSLREDLTH